MENTQKDYSFQDLNGANFQGADLTGADMCRANFQGADLAVADLTDADLQLANLEDADLQYAKLNGANLRGANFRFANLQNADLRHANLQHAIFQGANLDGALLDYQIEEGLLLKVAQHALQDGALNMSDWHTCDTTHCIVGWAEHLSTKTYILAETHGHQIAGLLTLGHEAHKYFWASNEDARKFLQSVVAANDERLAETVSLVLITN
jgi:hypothetical protein